MKKLKFTMMLSIAFTLVLLQQSTPASSQTQLFNMSYIFFGSPNSYVNQVDKTKGSLHVVSPNYFDINKDGELEVTWKLQTSFINEMHRRGIKVVPFVANHWDATAGINGLNKRDQLARRIADEVEKYNLDGVNVDIEGVNHMYRDEHTDFVRLLRSYIPKHKEVSVAVAANPNGWKTGWHGFYDYKALSNYTDYLMIMAYDESWESPDSPIGPVSSIQFFERSIQYAINQGVPKNKIVVGLPFYGRMWKLDGPTSLGKSITGMGVSSTRVQPLVDKFNGKINFDKNTQSSYATFTIPENQEAYIGSTTLTAGDYIIWYDNEPAIKAKLQLPNKYGIKGTGSWALYHETPDTWNYYSAWLNDIYFTDVALDYWAKNSISKVARKGWITGTSTTTFSPTKHLTRAEGAVIIVRALGQTNAVPINYQFRDTVGHWARKHIEVAREKGYLGGKSPTRFDPNAPLTREQLAQILYNIFDYPIDQGSIRRFPDVPSDKWSYNSIIALTQKGFIGGFTDGTFRPTRTSIRAEMAALMSRMEKEFDHKAGNQ
ncbi:glycosyl hydrolase family 18 protein [Oceanobacillus salinisoli]|uniref:glycosyl hydrolase family 18 protein n=1 Tax=Oceanobacillus salinisoli TaxID=2678611 RepID=UPI0012E0DFCF|nr:glycosyl hydrolase family 18 protein [Oceanobacillus salinisoli]